MHLNAYNEPPTINPCARICARALHFSEKKTRKSHLHSTLENNTISLYNYTTFKVLLLLFEMFCLFLLLHFFFAFSFSQLDITKFNILLLSAPFSSSVPFTLFVILVYLHLHSHFLTFHSIYKHDFPKNRTLSYS